MSSFSTWQDILKGVDGNKLKNSETVKYCI